MNFWVQPSNQNLTRSQWEAECISHAAITPLKAIPPERVGVNGEYDHSGLANRVMLALQAQFEAIEIAQLRVLQRGRVIILLGQISNWQLLTRLVSVASAAYGASTVETHGLRIRDEAKTC